MSEALDSAWVYQSPQVFIASAVAGDETAVHLAAAYAKSWRGEALTAPETGALEAAGTVPAHLAGDSLLGLIAHRRPDLLEALDALAKDLASAMPMQFFGDVLAWSALQDYAGRALAVVTDDMLSTWGGTSDV